MQRNPDLLVHRGAKMETALVVALRMQSGLEMISSLIEGRGAEAINLPAGEYKLVLNMHGCCDCGGEWHIFRRYHRREPKKNVRKNKNTIWLFQH